MVPLVEYNGYLINSLVAIVALEAVGHMWFSLEHYIQGRFIVPLVEYNEAFTTWNLVCFHPWQ
eukprot:c23030_g1_i3 orf=7-195(-)